MEAGEVQSWLDSAIDCGYIDQRQFDALDDAYDHIEAQLNLMMDQAEKWCASANTKRKR
jgi:four helix bundle protein